MRKKITYIGILLAFCVVSGVLLIFLLKPTDTDYDNIYNSEDIAHEHDESDFFIENEDDEMLIDDSPDTVKQVKLTNKSLSITIKRNKKDELYITEMDKSVPICSEYLEYVWCYAHSLGYNAKIISTTDMPLDISDYGIDSPNASLDITFSDGTKKKITVGQELPSGEDIYYFTLSGYDKTVFITEFSLALFQGEGYYIDTDFFSLEQSDDDVDIGRIQIKSKNENITLEPYSTKDRSDPSFNSSYKLTSPVKSAIDNENVTALVNELTYLSADSAVCSSPDKAKKAEFGLDKPQKIIRFERNKTEETVYIGKCIDKKCYIMISGIDAIYVLEEGNYESMLSACLSNLRSQVISTYTIDGIDCIDISFSGKNFQFTATRKPLDEKETYFEYHAFTDNGSKELDIAYYRRYIALLSSAGITGWDIDNKSSNTPEFTVKISYFDSFRRKDQVLDFYPSTSNNYLCSVDGKPFAMVSHIWINQIISATENLSENKAVTS